MPDNHKPIQVTKTFLPPRDEFDAQVNKIWDTNKLTNNGPLSKELESSLAGYLRLDKSQLRFVGNGTLALQLALRALDIIGSEVITTPFSYVATVSSILWEHCTPVFVDIDPETLNMDVSKIEAAVSSRTRAIMPVHVFGNPCDIENIQKISTKYDLKVIYDAAHAFGVEYKGRSIMSYGDISVCSFHATKIFHTTEGGMLCSKDRDIIEKVELQKRFGHNGDDHILLGINAKADEFNAAMGLANINYIGDIIEDRRRAHEVYGKYLDNRFVRQVINDGAAHNYSYYPVVFESEDSLLRAVFTLNTHNIFPRRYFYPSLNLLPYLENSQDCPISEDISKRILCLPLYYKISNGDIKKICKLLNK